MHRKTPVFPVLILGLIIAAATGTAHSGQTAGLFQSRSLPSWAAPTHIYSGECYYYRDANGNLRKICI